MSEIRFGWAGCGRRFGGCYAKRAAALLVCSALMSACVQVSVIGDAGPVVVERTIGGVRIELSQGAEPLVAEIRGVGYVNSPLGRSIGHTRQSIAVVPEDCRLVVWVEEERELAGVLRLLGSRGDACTTGGMRGL